MSFLSTTTTAIEYTPGNSGASSALVRIYLLGSPRVEWQERSLSTSRRQARALLYYLAMQSEAVSREQVCRQFWSNLPLAKAQHKLSRLLTHLRRALPTRDLLLAQDNYLALDVRRIWIDTRTFKRYCAAARSIENLKRATDLYRGRLLDGFALPTSSAFENWLDVERQEWERLYLEALTELIKASVALGEYRAAIVYIQRYLAVNNLAEDMHRRLIELYAAMGNRNAALRQFERCVAILESELGVSPLPETRAAYQAILQDDLPAEVTLTRKARWSALPNLDIPLLGRDDALAYLQKEFAAAQAGRGRIVFLAGETGIGKSRLMQTFVDWAGEKTTVLVGAGQELEQELPYGPLIQALKTHLAVTNWASLDISPPHLAELVHLLPELREMLPGLPPSASRKAELRQEYLFEVLNRWFFSLAEEKTPLVLCLDDLNWVDETTLSWLRNFIFRLADKPILLLALHRYEEGTPLETLRKEAMQLGVGDELTLEGLQPDQVLQFVRYLIKTNGGAEAFCHQLHLETGGNPFFLLEILQALFETGTIEQDVVTENRNGNLTAETSNWDHYQLPLPDTIHDAIQVRLSRLNSQTRQVIEAGAVIGHQFDFDLVKAVSGRSKEEVVSALTTLRARQVIMEHSPLYRFSHNLVRTVVYRNLAPARRRLLHRRAGEALEKSQLGNATSLARHFEEALQPGNAARYAMEAGLTAKTLFARAEAYAHFNRALVLLRRDGIRLSEARAITDNRRMQVQALIERGWALRLMGDMDAYVRDSAEMANLIDKLNDRRLLAVLRWREAYADRWFCRYSQARQIAEDGLAISRAVNDMSLEAMCQREIGLAAGALGNYRRARLALQYARCFFMSLGETVYEIHTMANLARIYYYVGEYWRAIDLSRHALFRCKQVQLPFERRLPLANLGAAAVATGEVELAEECLSESLTISRQVADRAHEIFCLGHLGWLSLKLNQPLMALEQLEAALLLARHLNSCAEQSWLHSGLAEAYRLMGKPDQAKEHVDTALELAQRYGCVYDQSLASKILTQLEGVCR